MKIRRSQDRLVGGVCGGIAEHLSVDPDLVRIISAILMGCFGVGIVAYFVLWIIMPE